jgi:hypothetical protein
MTLGSTPADDRPLRRVSWLDGQRLEAGDMLDATGREAFTRRVHTSAVHDAWGVALGFAVYLSDSGAEVAVGPGVAYDRQGREIVSGRQLTLPAPPGPDDGSPHWVDLVAHRAEAADLAAGRDPAGGCIGGGSVFEERPLTRWADGGPVRLGSDGRPVRPAGYGAGVRLGLDIPLARFQIQPDGTLTSADLSSRRTAHGLVRPHVAAGTARQGSVDITGHHLWWSMSIDTSAGGFTTDGAAYFVSLGAHPWGDTSSFNSGEVKASDASARAILAGQLPFAYGPFLEVSASTRTRFLLTVRHALAPQGPPGGRITTPANPVAVHWVGIEWVGGCEPVQTLRRFRPLGLSPAIAWSRRPIEATGGIA